MSLAAGRKLGPYEIGVPFGACGLGQRYSASDTWLDRAVAINCPEVVPRPRSHSSLLVNIRQAHLTVQP